MNPPARIPRAAGVEAAATALASCLDGLDDVLIDVSAAWGGLSTVYSAPEAQSAYQALAPLDPAAEDLGTAIAAAAAALATYGETLTGLETRREAIEADIALLSADDPSAPPAHEVRSARDAFDRDADEADRECARALRALREHTLWMADPLGSITGLEGSAVQGLGVELLERYRGALVTPGPGALLPDELLLTASTIHPDWPRIVIDGQTWVQRPSGLLALESTLLADAPAPSTVRPPGWDLRPQFTATPDVGAPPAWAGVGGKVLGVAGAGLTYWSVYSTSYNDTLTRHPDWTEEQRTQEAVVDTAVVGTTSVAAGAGGAWGGAVAGAAIGSVFPGPGTLIGGIVGGIIGGVAGGWGGQVVGQSVMDGVRGDNDDVIMAPGPAYGAAVEEPVL